LRGVAGHRYGVRDGPARPVRDEHAMAIGIGTIVGIPECR